MCCWTNVINAYNEAAGENGHTVHHPPASSLSPAFPPKTEPEAQEVI